VRDRGIDVSSSLGCRRSSRRHGADV